MTFLDRIDDRELRQEIRTTLARLEVLSDVRASAPGRSPRSSETPIGPPGFAGLSGKDCPPEDRSLFDHFRWRFEKAAEGRAPRKTLYFILWEAEKALRTRLVAPGPDDGRRALVLTRADENALIGHVLNDHEGTHSYKVSIDLDLPKGWVERIREHDGREPETGYRRPKWKELDEAMKRSIVSGLRDQGKTVDETARWLGVSTRTVVTYSRRAA